MTDLTLTRQFLMANDDRQGMSRSQAGQKGGQNQGQQNNPANFANDPQKAKQAGSKGGKTTADQHDMSNIGSQSHKNS